MQEPVSLTKGDLTVSLEDDPEASCINIVVKDKSGKCFTLGWVWQDGSFTLGVGIRIMNRWGIR